MTGVRHTPTTEDIRNCYLYAFEGYDGSLRKAEAISRAEFDRWLREHDAKVLEDARVTPDFMEYLPNDGEFEYTQSSDCDGSNVQHFRRRPRYVGGYFPWEPTSEEQYRAAAIREGTKTDE